MRVEYARLTGSLAECVFVGGEGVKNRTWSVMTTGFSLRLCSSGEKNRTRRLEKRDD